MQENYDNSGSMSLQNFSDSDTEDSEDNEFGNDSSATHKNHKLNINPSTAGNITKLRRAIHKALEGAMKSYRRSFKECADAYVKEENVSFVV